MADRFPLRALCLLLCLLGWPLSAAAATPQRIISLTPHLTELLYDIGAGDRIVATDDASDFPPEVAPLPRVANYRSINLEALLAQKPDLVVAWRSAQSRMLAPVEKLGIPVFYSEPTDFASLADEMRSLGRLLGTRQKADQQAEQSPHGRIGPAQGKAQLAPKLAQPGQRKGERQQQYGGGTEPLIERTGGAAEVDELRLLRAPGLIHQLGEAPEQGPLHPGQGKAQQGAGPLAHEAQHAGLAHRLVQSHHRQGARLSP